MATSDHTEAYSALEQAIRDQQSKLSGAFAVQRCLYNALLYGDTEESVMYAEVAQVVALLIREAIDMLDSVHFRHVTVDKNQGGAGDDAT